MPDNLLMPPAKLFLKRVKLYNTRNFFKSKPKMNFMNIKKFADVFIVICLISIAAAAQSPFVKVKNG